MLSQICKYLRNWFCVGVHKGTFTIEQSSISPVDFLQSGQYFRIVGSVFNDGVHKYPPTSMTAETFTGEVWAMAIPPDVISIAKEISDFQSAHPDSPYTSESFGGYTYQKATDSSGNLAGWKSVFVNRLRDWRKI